jgi:ribosomal protein L18
MAETHPFRAAPSARPHCARSAPGSARACPFIARASTSTAQVIDDAAGRTLASASSNDKDVKGQGGANVASAQEVGRRVAERAKAAGVSEVVFDRGGFLFHGRVKALADAAREGGLEF